MSKQEKDPFKDLKTKTKSGELTMRDLKKASNIIYDQLVRGDNSSATLSRVGNMMLLLDQAAESFRPNPHQVLEYEKLITPTNIYKEGGFYDGKVVPHYFEGDLPDLQPQPKPDSLVFAKDSSTFGAFSSREGYVEFKAPDYDRKVALRKTTPKLAAELFWERSDMLNGEIFKMRLNGGVIASNYGSGYVPTRVRPSAFLLENLGLSTKFTEYREWEIGTILLSQTLAIPSLQAVLVDLVETRGTFQERADRYSYSLRGKLRDSLNNPEVFLGENTEALIRFGVILDNMTAAEWKDVQAKLDQTKTHIFGGRTEEYKRAERILKVARKRVGAGDFESLTWESFFYAGDTAKIAARIQQKNRQVGKSEKAAAQAASNAAQELLVAKYYQDVLGEEPYFVSLFPKP